MKSTVACLLLALAGLSSANTYSYPRGCIYANGRCVQECPVGTLSYTIDCGYVTREATCRNSRPKPDTKVTCGYSACHCVHPTVRNEATGQCVHLDKCPQAKIIHGHGGGGKVKIERRPLDKKHHQLPVHPTVPVVPVVPAKPVVPSLPVAPTPPFVVAPTRPVVVAPTRPVVVAPTRPVVVAPTRPVVVAPTVPVAPSVPLYNNGYNTNNGYNGQSAYNRNSGYNTNYGYNNKAGYNTNSGYNKNAGYNTNSDWLQ